MDDPLDTAALNALLLRAREGEDAAWDDLLRRSHERLYKLARRMLRGFPSVRAAEETGDVLQGAMVRLLRALQVVAPASTRQYYGLAAEQIRRELLKLAERRRLPPGRVVSLSALDSGDALDPADPATTGEADLRRWTLFHEAVEALPDEEREVFALSFYQGWTQVRIAELCAVDERTIRRRWRAACTRLNERLGGRVEDL